MDNSTLMHVWLEEVRIVSPDNQRAFLLNLRNPRTESVIHLAVTHSKAQALYAVGVPIEGGVAP